MSLIQINLIAVSRFMNNSYLKLIIHLRHKTFWWMQDDDYLLCTNAVFPDSETNQDLPGGLHLPCGLWILKHFYNWFGL